MKYWIIVLSGFLFSFQLDAGELPKSIKLLAWLEGNWKASTETGSFEANLSSSDGGMILGNTRSVEGGKTSFYEFLKIEESNGEIILSPWPFGQPGVNFKATEITDSKVVFENPDHDFPKTITYSTASPHLLNLEAVGVKEGKPMKFAVEMNKMGNPSTDITKDFVLEASVANVWKTWTDNSRLEKWLTSKARVEEKLGGSYELFWDPSNPNENSTIGCKITAYVPNKLLSFEWKGPTPFADIMNVSPLPTWVSISLEEISTTRTLVHFRHSGWKADKYWNDARAWQEKAWDGAFGELQKYIKSMTAPKSEVRSH